MEQEQNKQETAIPPSGSVSGGAPNNSSSIGHATANEQADSPSFEQLLSKSQSAKLSSMGAWLKCLRKPALSVQYSIQKRHVPDLDADSAQQKQSQGQKPNQNQNPSAPSASSGKNSDVMGLDGDFTIRYFDLAMGVLGLSMLVCLIKSCSCIKRIMF